MKNLALMLVLVGVGCGGGPSSIDVCKRGCTKSISCTGGSTQDIDTCQTARTTKPVDVSACTNGNEIVSCIDQCITQKDCNDYPKCNTGCPRCITNGGDLSAQPTSDIGTQPVVDMAGASACHTLCQKLVMCHQAQSVAQCENGNTCSQLNGANQCTEDCTVANCLQPANSCNQLFQCAATCSQGCP